MTNTNNAGTGSLRQAITDSNADAGDLDRIHFNIPGTGPFAITLTTALPNLSQPVVIDATTQSGYSGLPVVQLVGNATAFNGLGVAAGNTTIRGLSITGFPGNGIQKKMQAVLAATSSKQTTSAWIRAEAWHAATATAVSG